MTLAPPPPHEAVERLEAEKAELLAEVSALTKALTGLTCGGSEFFIRKGERFVADIPACVAWVRRAREDAHKNIVKAYGERNKARAHLRQVEAARLASPSTPGTEKAGE